MIGHEGLRSLGSRRTVGRASPRRCVSMGRASSGIFGSAGVGFGSSSLNDDDPNASLGDGLLFGLCASARLLAAVRPTFGGVPWEHRAHHAMIVHDDQCSFGSLPDRLIVAVLALYEVGALEVTFEGANFVERGCMSGCQRSMYRNKACPSMSMAMGRGFMFSV